jgi:hypothetical protein
MSKGSNKSLHLSSRKVLFGVLCALFIVSIFAVTVAMRGVQASSETSSNFSGNFSAQSNPQSPDNIWQFIEETSIVRRGERQIVPQTYRTVRVDEAALKLLLGKAPLESTPQAKAATVMLNLPMPDGAFQLFRIEESPIMEAPLAAQFPEIKTYHGKGIDDPTATTRFDFTPTGFHAMILSERGTIFIDPYSKGDTANYITYFKADYRNEAKQFQCYFSEENQPAQSPSQSLPNVVNGTILRTYRLAVAASIEYTNFHGGTKPLALAAITTTINRVDGLYESELAIRLVLVANETNIIFTTATGDVYNNTSGDAVTNQGVLDQAPPAGIGSANYDIGHVFNTGGGGLAYFGVCDSNFKAKGVTGSPSPVGDGFDIDYVAHEMGHQFHANHTFNGTTSNCSGNRVGSAAYEPGSGSTIMAYAGICGAQDLQPHSDDYFHVKSLEEIAAFVATTACDVETSTGNSVPTVSVGSTVTIPKSTPFTLTATGSDPNGDALTYCWEEYDLGSASPPDTDASGSRPIFRTFNPTSNASRTFPKLSDIVNNTSTYGESLPTISRTMNFQVTVRDNRIGGGGINTATKQVVVSASAGPFLVTAPNTNISWTGGTQQTVTWDVANTTAAPVSAANVKISLSTDGGNTFPIVLSASTPNDGSEAITVPNNATTTARVKVEAVGNVFFDISNANFTIVAGSGCTYTISPTNQTFTSAAGTGTVGVTTQTGCTWTAVSNDVWITVTSGASGTGSGNVGFSVGANAGSSQRTGTITIAGQTFTVTQAGNTSGCNYSIAPTGKLFGSSSGTGSVSVTTTAGCNWTAVSNDAWLTVTSGASGSGNGTVNYSVATNPNSSQRVGTLTIAGQTFTVTQIGAGCVTLLSPSSVSLTTGSASLQVRVDAPTSCNWTITNVPAWVTFTSGTTGTGTKKVNYTVAANTDVARHADVAIGGQILSIDQAGTSGTPCTYTINPTSQNFIASGGSSTVAVTTQTGCTWTAVSNDVWITVTSGASGTGSGNVGFSVAVNASSSLRTGTITIAGQTFTVTQSGATPSCSYALNPSSQSYASSGGSGAVAVATAVGCAWTAVSNDAWLTVTSGASGSGSGTVNYTVAANASTSPRTGTITIAGQTFTVTQTGVAPTCSYSISPSSKSVNYGQVSGSVSVTATAGCTWTAVSNVTWITVTSGANGTGNGIVGYTVLANPNRATRSGTITIAGQTFTVNQAAKP